MLENLKLKIQMWWDDFEWRHGPERVALARSRISAHDLAMKLGYESPYTDPDNYNTNWEPIHIKRKEG